ncbi:DNA mismatch repair protein MutS [Maribacter algarum]|uniref:DNA mismatch repair protein MutS n=1 Tax=Maribacter algarum (ex Zhang et al. 2020) TaxID=2578118 RepID=A0A5S3QKK0_9FLAO|nr:DNA mismatch repair protein MutS [Maribacter algarum]TMM58364.1 DNA mismatch repair protein MutS [Maribacter algarum]
MQDLASFYKNQIKKHTETLSKVRQQLAASSTIRLLVFIVIFIAIYLLFGKTKLVLGVALVGIIAFLFLVSRHTDLQYKRDKIQALKVINETEVKVLNRDFHHLPAGNVFKDSNHYFSQDIDLFGRGSFYQYSNRTALRQGSETLAGLFVENSIEDISQKQEAIQELASMPEWRQEFSAVASLTKTQTTTTAIQGWLENYTPFVPSVMKYLPLVFSILSIVSFALYFLDYIPESVLVLLLVIGFGISGVFTKKITKLGTESSRAQSTFEQYNKLLLIIEHTDFKSAFLKDKKQQIIREGKKTSTILKEFSKLLGNLDQNNNIFYLIFGNGYFLRGLATSYKIEQWIAKHGHSSKEWFEVIAFFDAYISLGTFAFNHPNYAFPILSDDSIVLKSKDAGHPLLDPEKSVMNDFQIDNEQFFIITGANMAGKSTFLRTVSLQLVMANVGLPVCACETKYNPIKLITSMRTTDSLTDDESYFFSELKRLKFIVDEIQTDRFFIVLDEILKGTNSTDKAKGSRKFVEKLVGSKSTGIIATHDLSLCEVAKELPQIKNHYFDAEIIDNELHFDYKFKEGICQNMNASFLLKKMQIVE